jgi:hypothetical protein
VLEIDAVDRGVLGRAGTVAGCMPDETGGLDLKERRRLDASFVRRSSTTASPVSAIPPTRELDWASSLTAGSSDVEGSCVVSA